MDLTGKMLGITVTDADLKSVIGLHPEFPLRAGAIYQLYGKVLGDSPIGIWLELHWVGKPKPPGGIQPWRVGAASDPPGYLVQWPWVITMTLHLTDPAERWLKEQLETIEEPPQHRGLREADNDEHEQGGEA